MSTKRHLWRILSAALLVPFFAEAIDEDTLTRDYAFESPGNTWNVKHAKVDRIEAFEGLADTFFYLNGTYPERLEQKQIKVKPETWYVVNYVYRSERMLWFSGEVKASADGKVLGRGTAYDAPAWRRGKFFFYSGKYDSADLCLNIHTEKAAWQIGRIVIRPMTRAEYENCGMMSDSGFEQVPDGVMRSPDLHWSVKVVSENPFSGKKCARFDFPENAKGMVYFSAGQFFMRPGDILSGSIKVRAQRPVKIHITMLNFAGETRVPARTVTADVGTGWSEVPFEFRPVPMKNETGGSGSCFLFFHFTPKDAPNTVWFDDLEFSVQRAENKPAKSGKVIAVNPSFEVGLDGWETQFDETVEEYGNVRNRMSVDTDAVVGRYSLKVVKPLTPPEKRKFTKTLIRALPFHLPLNRDFTISFWAKSNRPTTLSVGLPYTGIGNFKLSSEWKRYTAQFKAMRGLHTAGTETELRILSANDGATVWLDGVQIEPGKNATAFQPDAAYEAGTVIPDRTFKLVKFGETFPLRVYAASYTDAPKGKTVRVTVSDFFNRTVFQKDFPFSVNGKDTQTFDFNLKGEKPGDFHARAEILDADGKVLAGGDSAFAVLKAPPEIPLEKSLIGMNEDFATYRSGVPAYLMQGNNNFTDSLAALRLMGVRHIRTWAPGNWASQEPEKGKYRFLWKDYLTQLKKNGFGTHVVFLNGPKPVWSQSKTGYLNPERRPIKFIPRLDDTLRFAEAYAKHYRGLVDSFGWMNETEDFPPENYVEFAKHLHPLFRKFMPGTKFSGASYPMHCLPLPGPDNSWIADVIRAGFASCTDVMIIHRYDSGQAHSIAYLNKMPFENLPVDKWGPIPDMLELQIKKFRKEQGVHEIWDDESGFMFNRSSSWGRSSAYESDLFGWYTNRVATARMVRFWIAKAGAGVSRQYNFTFLGQLFGGPGQLMHFDSDLTPLPSVPAMSQLARVLDGSMFHSKFKLGRDTLVYVFKMFNGKTAAVYWNWNLENAQDGTFTIPETARVLAAYDIMGGELPLGKNVFPLQDCPVYLISEQSPEEFAAQLRKAKAVAIPFTPFIQLGNADGHCALIASVQSNSDQVLNAVRLNVRSEGAAALVAEKTVSVPGMNLQKTIFPLAETGKGNAALSLCAQYGGRIYSAVHQENIAVLNRAESPVILLKKDGVEADLSGYWTPDSLNFNLKVKDSTPHAASAEEFIWDGDSVEFYLDFAPEDVNMGNPRYHRRAIRINIVRGNPVRMEYFVDGAKTDAASFPDFDPGKVKAVCTGNKDGYEIALTIPVKCTLAENMALGFNLNVLDAFPSKNPKKYEVRSLSMQQKACWNDIRNFGKLILK